MKRGRGRPRTGRKMYALWMVPAAHRALEEVAKPRTIGAHLEKYVEQTNRNKGAE